MLGPPTPAGTVFVPLFAVGACLCVVHRRHGCRGLSPPTCPTQDTCCVGEEIVMSSVWCLLSHSILSYSHILACTYFALESQLAFLKLCSRLVDSHDIWELFALGTIAAWGCLFTTLALAQVQAVAAAVCLGREAIAHGVDVATVWTGLCGRTTALFACW